MLNQELQENKTYETLSKTKQWFADRARSAHARVWLGVFSFTESCIFFIPPDPLLAALVFLHKERWFFYSILTVTASVLGAVFGYIVGAVLFETIGAHIIATYGLTAYFLEAQKLIEQSVFVFTLTAAFTPIPFKVAVLTAGFTKANFFAFVLAAIIGRTARYMFVAYVAKVFGDNAESIMRRFWWYTGALGVFIVIALIAYYFFL